MLRCAGMAVLLLLLLLVLGGGCQFADYIMCKVHESHTANTDFQTAVVKGGIKGLREGMAISQFGRVSLSLEGDSESKPQIINTINPKP